ncbi:MAG TPA: hypothetical protein VHQ90_16215 [Thermoanaerobaculia bacterium]|nr:hypothetical protein [Thermoanaerobaculia bacterium]
MRFVNSTGELDGRTYTRTYAEEVRQVLTAIDGVLNGDKAIYASSELTTCRKLYELLRAHGVRDAAELHEKLAGRALTVEAGRERLDAAAGELDAAGFDAIKLRQSLAWLATL